MLRAIVIPFLCIYVLVLLPLFTTLFIPLLLYRRRVSWLCQLVRDASIGKILSAATTCHAATNWKVTGAPLCLIKYQLVSMVTFSFLALLLLPIRDTYFPIRLTYYEFFHIPRSADKINLWLCKICIVDFSIQVDISSEIISFIFMSSWIYKMISF